MIIVLIIKFSVKRIKELHQRSGLIKKGTTVVISQDDIKISEVVKSFGGMIFYITSCFNVIV
ncbi:MAG: hypothetical protein B6D34_02080 [Candidatus Brocadia sp. UTAMX1]|nr:MAG: hypothetical protein B6D34_02080 [Candidatus Brocadia sp. UTAMX1]